MVDMLLVNDSPMSPRKGIPKCDDDRESSEGDGQATYDLLLRVNSL